MLQVWRRGGIQARRQLFDGAVHVLKDIGVSVPHVPKAVA